MRKRFLNYGHNWWRRRDLNPCESPENLVFPNQMFPELAVSVRFAPRRANSREIDLEDGPRYNKSRLRRVWSLDKLAFSRAPEPAREQLELYRGPTTYAVARLVRVTAYNVEILIRTDPAD